ncbi:MAG: tetratricopeptide repeat protein [Planctomycetota bacterium]|nr:tetratricopeptide repeat protein [Planctomycetota bacterium]
MKRLNIKLAVVLLVSIIVLGTGVHFLHGFQVRRHSEGLLENAKTEREKGNFKEATEFCFRYLSHEKDSDEGNELLANILYDEAELPDSGIRKKIFAVQQMETVVRKNPDNTVMRRKLLEYMVKYRNPGAALDHGVFLKEAGKSDSDLDFMLGQCKIALADFDGAATIYREMVGYDKVKKTFDAPASAPDKVDAYPVLADLLRKAGSDAEADAVIERMVEANPKSSEAFINRYRYWAQLKNEKKSEASLDEAAKLNPEAADVLLLLSNRAAVGTKLDDARKLLTRGVELYPKDWRLHAQLAMICRAQGELPRSVEICDAGLEQLPENEELLRMGFELALITGDFKNARKKIAALEASVPYNLPVPYYEGLALVAEGQSLDAEMKEKEGEKKWKEAEAKLNEARPLVAQVQAYKNNVDLQLAKVYKRIHQPEKEREILGRLNSGNNNNMNYEAILRTAESLLQSGRMAEALAEYEKLAAALGENLSKNPRVWGPLFNLRLMVQAQRPKESQKWEQLTAMVEELKKSPDIPPASLTLMDAEVKLRSGNQDEARKLLVGLRDSNPEDPQAWIAMCKFEAQAKGPQDALNLASKAPEKIRDGVIMRLLRANFLNQIGGQQAKAGLRTLEIGIDQLTPEEQNQLLSGLANEYRRANDADSSARIYKKLMEKLPEDAGVRLQYFDLVRAMMDVEEMKKTSAEIQKLLGTDRPEIKILDTICKITTVMKDQYAQRKANQPPQLSDADKELLIEARSELDELLKVRTELSEPHLLLAEIAGLENNADEVIKELKLAMQYGTINSAKVSQLYQLMVAKGDLAGAEELQRKFSSELASDSMEQSQFEVAIRTGKMDEAKKLLEASKPSESAKPTEQLWYAEAQRRVGNFAESERVLRDVIKKQPETTEGWLSLVKTLASAGNSAEGMKVVEEAMTKAPEKERHKIAAQCYEVLGEGDRAAAQYELAVAAKPDDVKLLQAVASFYLRAGQIEQIEKHLDSLTKLLTGRTEPQYVELLSWARRARAVAMVSKKKDWKTFLIAKDMVSQPDGKRTLEDNLLIVGLLANRNEPSSMREALRLLQEIQAKQDLQPAEQVKLALLHESVGQVDKANDTMLTVVSKPNAHPEHYLAYAEFLMRANRASEVDSWLRSYEEKQPAAKGSGPVLALRAGILVKEGKAKEGVDLLLNALGPAPWPQEKWAQVQGTIGTLENLEQYDAAEKLLREYVKDDPRAMRNLAMLVGMHRDLNEAFQILATVGKDPNQVPGTVAAALELLRARRAEAKPEHFVALAGWYSSLKKQNPESLQLEAMMGDIREIRNELNESEKIYRKLLAREDLTESLKAAMSNNLAYILALKNEKMDEAIQLVNFAMEVYGPTSDLLDTRGTIYLAMGNTDAALKDLQDSVLVPSSLKLVHLAFAQHAAKDIDGAKTSIEKARQLKLNPKDLHPTEQKKLEAITTELNL